MNINIEKYFENYSFEKYKNNEENSKEISKKLTKNISEEEKKELLDI